MSTEILSRYLSLYESTDLKQKELGIRILDLYEKAHILGLEVRWPDLPLKEKIISLIETNLQFQIESLFLLLDMYQKTDPIAVPFLSPPYNKRTVQKFTKQCKENPTPEKMELPPSMRRQQRWCRYFLQQLDSGILSMELIPRGSFRMGHATASVSARSVHKVKITNDFWIGRTPITQKKYKRIHALIKEKEPDFDLKSSPSYFVGPLRPVESLAWFDCLRFCNALSRLEEREEVYDLGGLIRISSQEDFTKITCNLKAEGYRLPTEAEWEYAARAGRSFDFSGDDESEMVCWNINNSVVLDRNCTISVASKKPNAWRLFDMSGNVDEWCWDGFEFGFYSKSPERDPMGASTAPSRVVRGGAYDAEATPLWERNHANPIRARDDVGFRLVRTVFLG
jgi:formylglycine-generating enzyme required for sulfatase activity